MAQMVKIVARLLIHLAVCITGAATLLGTDINACNCLIRDFAPDPCGILASDRVLQMPAPARDAQLAQRMKSRSNQQRVEKED
jgi:hypothetical protein